ncbi:MBL fold metallo-hydrolase [Thermodesulfobacteriota bacterium]
MTTEIIERIKWLGHDGFEILTNGIRVVIDPYQVKSGKPADIIMITHPHFDHCSIEDIDKLKKPSTIYIADPVSAGKLSGDVRIVRPGDTVTIDKIQIDAVPAYNIDKEFHPKTKNWLGFIVTIDGVRIYHAGDTDLIPEMEDFSVDIALLPVSGTYVMTADEAIEAAKVLKPEAAIPMHYDTIVGSSNDAEKFKNALEEICEVVILTA